MCCRGFPSDTSPGKPVYWVPMAHSHNELLPAYKEVIENEMELIYL